MLTLSYEEMSMSGVLILATLIPILIIRLIRLISVSEHTNGNQRLE